MTSLVRTLVILFFAVSIFSGCSPVGDSPEKVAEKFLTALNNEDWETAEKYSTKGTHKLLDMLESFAAMADEEGAPEREKNDFKMEGCKEDGDAATCMYCCNEEGGSDEVPLLKVDGEWKVNMVKEQSMSDAMDDVLKEMEQGEEEMGEEMEEMGELIEELGTVLEDIKP